MEEGMDAKQVGPCNSIQNREVAGSRPLQPPLCVRSCSASAAQSHEGLTPPKRRSRFPPESKAMCAVERLRAPHNTPLRSGRRATSGLGQ